MPVALAVALLVLGADGLGGSADRLVGPWTLGPAVGVALCLLALPAAVVAIAVQDGIGRALGRLAQALLRSDVAGEGPVREMLAERLGDRSLNIAYWLPDREIFVDERGHPVALPGAGSGRAWTAVEREGNRVAAIVHDAELDATPELVHAAASAASLALDNERLKADLRARLEELRHSRRRIVEAADDARRQIERDLHDGAQQQLVSLALDLRLLRSRLREDPEAAATVDELGDKLAAALGVSTMTGLQLLADALDLQHRLPRLWAAVETLAVAPWKARKIAQATHNLSRAAAASVDAQLADRIGSCGWRAIKFAVAQAIASYDPHLLETREKQGRDAWGVRLFHRGVCTDGADDWVGTSHLEVTGDTLDLTTFHDLVCDQAAQLKALGDTDTLEVRKAKAVGVIANRQATLDLGTLLGHDDRDASRAGSAGAARGQDQALPPPVPDRPARARRLRQQRRGRVRDRGEVRAGDHRPDQGLGRPGPGHHPTRPGHGPHRRRRCPRPTRLDAGIGHPARSALCVPVVHPRRQSLRPGPHHPVRGERPTRARPGPTPSPPSADGTTGRRPSADGATTAPRPATTNGPDPKARPTWSPRPAPSPSRPTETRPITRPPTG